MRSKPNSREKVKDQTTKFYFVVLSLPEQVLERIPDMLETPPAVDEYDTIKQRVLSTYQRPSSDFRNLSTPPLSAAFARLRSPTVSPLWQRVQP